MLKCAVRSNRGTTTSDLVAGMNELLVDLDDVRPVHVHPLHAVAHLLGQQGSARSTTGRMRDHAELAAAVAGHRLPVVAVEL